MPSRYSLRNTGWKATDFGGIPSRDEIEVTCDNCGDTTTADEMEGWDTTTDMGTYETTVLCQECSTDE